jgi:hypothetical protein
LSGGDVTGRLPDDYSFRTATADARSEVLAFIAALPLERLYVSVVIVAGLIADAGKRAELSDRLQHRVRPVFEGGALSVTGT